MVVVTVSRTTNGRAGTQDKLERGGHFVVREGHLYVLTGTYDDSPTIASYAPGQWSSVEVRSEE